MEPNFKRIKLIICDAAHCLLSTSAAVVVSSEDRNGDGVTNLTSLTRLNVTLLFTFS